jgi:hypothetical protein
MIFCSNCISFGSLILAKVSIATVLLFFTWYFTIFIALEEMECLWDHRIGQSNAVKQLLCCNVLASQNQQSSMCGDFSARGLETVGSTKTAAPHYV